MTIKLPLNRFITFVKPVINIVAAGVAAWLVGKVQILGVLGIGQDQVATQIASGLAALITAGVLQAADLKWLKGHHIDMQVEGAIAAASITAASPTPDAPEDEDDIEPVASDVEDDVAVPAQIGVVPDSSNTPVQPSQVAGQLPAQG